MFDGAGFFFASRFYHIFTPQNMTMERLTQMLRRRLAARYEGGELDGVVRALCEDLLGLGMPAMLFATVDDLDAVRRKAVDAAVSRLLGGEPVQHVTGVALFRGLRLHVTGDTLIPRPETGGLVNLADEAFAGRDDVSVIDLCTGSGCVAIAVAHDNPSWGVSASDISPAAVEVARANAAACGVDVAVDVADVFTVDYAPAAFDLVTCNPPYVLPSERAGMDDTVLSHEPPSALFVPEDDPLLFYRVVGDRARRWLKPGGVLLFEINRAFPRETCDLLRSLGYGGVVAVRDYVGNWRFVKACRL